MKKTFLALTVLTSVSAYQSYDEGYYDDYGFNSFSPVNATTVANTSSSWDLWAQTPNPPRWVWSINITEAPSTNTSVSNATQLYTTYAFEWPEDVPGGLQAQIDWAQSGGNLGPSGNFCVSVVQSLFPANTTNGFNPNGTGAASCGSGPFFNCYNAFLRAWYASERDASGCLGRGVDPSTLAGCQGTWETYNVETYNLGSADIQNGDRFFYRATEQYTAGNTTYLDAERNRMHMIIMDYAGANEIVCARAAATNASLETGGVDDLQSAASFIGLNLWFAGLIAVVAVCAMV